MYNEMMQVKENTRDIFSIISIIKLSSTSLSKV